MPRPKVERTPRLIRLPAEVDAVLVREARAHGLSINEAVEESVKLWLANRSLAGMEIHRKDGNPRNNDLANIEVRPARSRQVTPIPKKGKR